MKRLIAASLLAPLLVGLVLASPVQAGERLSIESGSGPYGYAPAFIRFDYLQPGWRHWPPPRWGWRPYYRGSHRDWRRDRYRDWRPERGHRARWGRDDRYFDARPRHGRRSDEVPRNPGGHR